MGKSGALHVQDFWESSTQTTKDFEGKFGKKGEPYQGLWTLLDNLIEQFRKPKALVEGESKILKIGFGPLKTLLGGSFVLPNKIVYTLLLLDFTALKVANKRWDGQDPEET